MVTFFNFETTSNHLHSLQVENCGSNSLLVVDEDDNGEFRIERVKVFNRHLFYLDLIRFNTKFPVQNCSRCTRVGIELQ